MNESTSSRRLQRVFAARATSASDARAFASAVLSQDVADGKIDAAIVDTVRLVVSELVSNAVQHGQRDDEVRVAFDLSDERCLVIEVAGGRRLPADRADPAGWKIAPPDGASGRGLGIVRSLVDDVHAATIDGVVVVRCGVAR